MENQFRGKFMFLWINHQRGKILWKMAHRGKFLWKIKTVVKFNFTGKNTTAIFFR